MNKYVILLVLLSGCAAKIGPQGGQGLQGTAGTNAPLGMPIQLCSACKPSYPNTFPESALCIDNNLYGVYSANDGFLSVLPPGAYSSDGINCKCTFTIEPNCIIT